MPKLYTSEAAEEEIKASYVHMADAQAALADFIENWEWKDSSEHELDTFDPKVTELWRALGFLQDTSGIYGDCAQLAEHAEHFRQSGSGGRKELEPEPNSLGEAICRPLHGLELFDIHFKNYKL